MLLPQLAAGVARRGKGSYNTTGFCRLERRFILSRPQTRSCPRKVERSGMISFSERAIVPSNVLIRFLEHESVLLNVETERYFGLDAVGTRMWQVVTAAPSLDVALAQLNEEYDVLPETLRSDLTSLLQHLVENGLITLQPADVGTASPV